MAKRGLLPLASLYVTAALTGRARERRGAIRCGCETSCWCQRPGLGLFRWVLPVAHRGQGDRELPGGPRPHG